MKRIVGIVLVVTLSLWGATRHVVFPLRTVASNVGKDVIFTLPGGQQAMMQGMKLTGEFSSLNIINRQGATIVTCGEGKMESSSVHGMLADQAETKKSDGTVSVQGMVYHLPIEIVCTPK